MPDEFKPKAAELPEWLAFVWRAWERLQADRPWHASPAGGLVPGRIPWRDVMRWADRQNLSPEMAEFLDYGIAVVEGAFQEWWKMDAQRKGGRGGA